VVAVCGLGRAHASGEEEGAAQEPTMADLQQQIDELEARFGKTPATGGSGATMKVFGRIHLDAWTFPSTDPGINLIETGDPSESPESNVQFRRARIGVSGDIQSNMLYKAEIDFAHPDGLRFKDLYFGFEDVPVLQTLLIGNQKRPYGLDHLNSSRYNVFLERPFIVEGLNQDARRMGVASYGTSEEEDWNWRYGAYLLQDMSGTGEIVGDEIQPELAARLARNLWNGDEGRSYGHLALSGAVAWPNDMESGSAFKTRPEARSQSKWLDTGMIPGADNYVLAGLEALGNWGRTQATGEVLGTHVNRSGGMEDVDFMGGYFYLAFFLTDDHMPWDRESGTLARIKPSRPLGEAGGWGGWQIAARYSYADFTDEDIYGGVGNALTLGLNWYWNDHAGMQFNYIKGTIDERQDSYMGTPYDGGDYDILGIRFRVDF
jgi:phosphate-selective porin OprO/OprP